MPFDSVEYHSRVWQQTNEPATINNTIQPHLPDDAIIPIKFQRNDYSVLKCHSENDEIWFLHEPILAFQKTIADVSFSTLMSFRGVAAELVCGVLSRMALPEATQLVVLNEIYTVLESAKTVMPICVNIIKEMTQHVEITSLNEDVIQRVIRESMEANEVKGIPAAKSTIEGLERVKVKVDDFGDEKKECVICMESFEDGVKAIRLPCSHIFHEKCCVQWLMTSQLCPLCRYRVPSEQDLLANS